MAVTMTDNTDWLRSQPGCGKLHSERVAERAVAVQAWGVTVSVNGADVLTIGHNHLAGIENIDDYADVVRSCAQHLLSFIGGETGDVK
jgi:hypothetical protein